MSETSITDVAPPPYPGNDQYDLTPTPHTANRPRLPEDKRNSHLIDLSDDAKIVKFQTIVREGKEIVVGRIKVPTETNSGPHHAFILRRYDTNAISLTTMYRVAFPGASEEDEKREMDWVKSSFDIRGTNGGRDSDAVRLAGQWVSRNLAIHIAPAYNLTDLVAALARAVPDPNVAYRKSQRSQAAAEEIARQRVRTDAEAETTTIAPIFNSVEPMIQPSGDSAPSPIVPSLTNAESSLPASKRRRKGSVPEETLEDNSPVIPQIASHSEDIRHVTVEATTTITSPSGAVIDIDSEIAQAKQLVQDLRQELQLRSEAGNELEEQGIALPEDTRGVKRVKGDGEGVVISGGAGKSDRIVRTNKRVFQNAAGDAARFGWGALVFSVGLGASLTLFSQYASSLL
nr:hypothetical protein L203_06265 [Cryptococcus depauperatus CBS 7841]